MKWPNNLYMDVCNHGNMLSREYAGFVGVFLFFEYMIGSGHIILRYTVTACIDISNQRIYCIGLFLGYIVIYHGKADICVRFNSGERGRLLCWYCIFFITSGIMHYSRIDEYLLRNDVAMDINQNRIRHFKASWDEIDLILGEKRWTFSFAFERPMCGVTTSVNNSFERDPEINCFLLVARTIAKGENVIS